MKLRLWLAVIALTAAPAFAPAQIAIYSNTVTGNGTVLNGGATLQGANTITNLVMDDLQFAAGTAGSVVNQITFGIQNSNAVTVSARPRLRFWNADGAGGGPGTYFAGIGFSFNPIAFAPGGSAFFFDPGATFIIPPAERLWFGITFDNNNGATGATAAQLNNLGQLLFDPPTIGSSTDNIFVTSAAGSFFLTDNPAGSLTNFAGAPVANIFWQVQTVPEPSSMAFAGLALGGVLYRRIRRKA